MDGSLKKLVPEEIDRIGPEFAQWGIATLGNIQRT